MGWTNDTVTELIAPSNVPFVPGNNVTGLGSTIPTELATAGFNNAIVFYASDWNAANTTPTVKFRFIAASGTSGFVIGYGLVNNPSVSQTATVVLSEAIQNPSNTNGVSLKNSSGVEDYLLGQIGGNAYMRLKDQNATTRMDVITSGTPGSSYTDLDIYDNALTRRIWLDATDGSTGGTNIQMVNAGGHLRIWLNVDESTGVSSVNVYDNTGTIRGQFITNQSVMNLKIGDATIIQTFGSGYIQSTYYWLYDSAWSALPLVNGWTGDAVRVPLMRRMADGTVQFKGVITKAANPVNGELWMNAISGAYAPQHTWSFLTPTPGRAYNGSQVVEIRSNGTGVIFDMAAASGVICLDGVRYYQYTT